jgi:bifunctional non-homologous end joining protein LigD
MRVATWNINNVVKRIDLLCDWLTRTRPDVVALQELKTPTADFPLEELRASGYEALVVGQRTWNGVALLARGHEPLPVVTALPGDPSDKEARYCEAAINGVLYACLYLPNGNPQPGPKFDYKLRWFERLCLRAQELWNSGQPVVLLGDWNVVPTDDDIYKPDTWRDDALLQPRPRKAFADVLSQGWTDTLESVHPGGKQFTFWDYRRKRWERNAGLRIDHILVGAALKVVDAGVDRDERGREGASDHAPVWAEIQQASPKRQARRATSAAATNAPKRATPSNDPPPAEPLARYNAKRDFTKTAEPSGTAPRGRQTSKRKQLAFVIQKHWASRLHYDLRLELGGVMVSWAVPKGPTYDPALKQMAIHVEDHPISYNTFEGEIPKGEYGGGTVIVWDRGTWEPVGDPQEAMAKGKLIFKLHGEKLAGLWELVRISKPGEKKQEQWLLLKKRGDAWARPSTEYNVITALPDSVVAKPLGLVEEREPRERPRASRPSPAEAAQHIQLGAEAALPAKLQPQLATLVSSVPPGDWVVEGKFDGYRMLARIEGGRTRLFTRNGHDWTDKLQPIADALAELGLDSAWLDGEIVVLNEAGIPDFNLLQNAIDNTRTANVEMFLFDVPFLGGKDIREVALASRRAALQELFESNRSNILHFSQAFDVVPGDLLNAACQMGMEGVMVKKADAPYVSGRTETWLKLKCQNRQEFVVVGYTDRAGAPGEVGSLLLGFHEGGELRFAGSVGTGWGSAKGRELKQALSKLAVDAPTVDTEEAKPGRWSKRRAGEERWVQPRMVVEVAFSEWTPDGRIRHPVFRGVRTDKPPNHIIRERPKAAGGKAIAASSPPAKSTIKVTNPERVIDPSTGLRKVDLVRYYESVAEWMLPHLKGRPVSLVRGPSGITGELFFQKHDDKLSIPHVRNLPAHLWSPMPRRSSRARR